MKNSTIPILFSVVVLAVVGGAISLRMQAPQDTEPILSNKVEVAAAIDEEARALGVTVIPRKLLEDSRCPVDVQCIQAGTVRVEADLSSGLGRAKQIFKLGETVTTEAEQVTFLRVEPATKQSTVEVPLVQYRFVFEVAKR